VVYASNLRSNGVVTLTIVKDSMLNEELRRKELGSLVSFQLLLSKIGEGVLIKTLMILTNRINQRGGQSLERGSFIIIVKNSII
jgi:hypothetical protein